MGEICVYKEQKRDQQPDRLALGPSDYRAGVEPFLYSARHSLDGTDQVSFTAVRDGETVNCLLRPGETAHISDKHGATVFVFHLLPVPMAAAK